MWSEKNTITEVRAMKKMSIKAVLFGMLLGFLFPVLGFADGYCKNYVQTQGGVFCGDNTYPYYFYKMNNLPRDQIPGDYDVQMNGPQGDKDKPKKEAGGG